MTATGNTTTGNTTGLASFIPTINITPGYNIGTEAEMLALTSAAKRAGINVANPLDPTQDLGVIELVGRISLAIGVIPVISDTALNTLPAAIQDEVRRARAVQSQRAALHLDLTPSTSLVIAQANSKAGTDGWIYQKQPPLGLPLGDPVNGTYFTHS